MRVRYIEKPDVEGYASRWNPSAIGSEVVLWFDDGSATSEEISLLEPVDDTRERWIKELDVLLMDGAP